MAYRRDERVFRVRRGHVVDAARTALTRTYSGAYPAWHDIHSKGVGFGARVSRSLWSGYVVWLGSLKWTR